jgi:hypothetical protein
VPSTFPTGFLSTQLDERYRLDRLIGEGSSAWVFAAHDVRLERNVAVKLFKNSPELRRRFVLEGQILAKMVHPNVVPVYDAGVTREGAGFLVMELCEAGTLEVELFRREVLAAEEAVHLLFPLLGALACAHDHGIVHRDVKPGNIVLASENGERYAKVLDFGIAKRADSASTDSASGTPSYMAPEQASGKRPSAAADIWSVGVVFYRCLSGTLPFPGETNLVTLQKLVNERAPRFADACAGLSKHLGIALDRALERYPEQRYGDMRSFAQALAAACEQDGISLPARRAPFGLWRPNTRANRVAEEITRPLRGPERAGAAPRRPWPSVRHNPALLLVRQDGHAEAPLLTEAQIEPPPTVRRTIANAGTSMKRNMLTRSKGPLLLCRQTGEEPSEQEWSEFLRVLAAGCGELEAKNLKVLVLTDGGAPNAEQRKRLVETLSGCHPQVACISDSVKVRFASVLITLFQHNYRHFSLAETKHAFAHLELTPAQCDAAQKSLQELEAALRLGAPG